MEVHHLTPSIGLACLDTPRIQLLLEFLLFAGPNSRDSTMHQLIQLVRADGQGGSVLQPIMEERDVGRSNVMNRLLREANGDKGVDASSSLSQHSRIGTVHQITVKLAEATISLRELQHETFSNLEAEKRYLRACRTYTIDYESLEYVCIPVSSVHYVFLLD